MKIAHLRLVVLSVFCLVSMLAVGQKPEPYFNKEQLPNALNFLPPPPDTVSPQFMYDLSQYMWGKTLRNTPRGEQARLNAQTEIDQMLKQFSDAFGYELSATTTPAIYKVCNNGVYTIHYSGAIPKKHYHRKRPYTRMGEASLIPEEEELLRNNGSYPSGHTLMGWGLALLLVEINPDRQDEIFNLGYQWGQSRVIAGYHWQSDIDAGRLLASTSFARLHTSPRFLQEMREAQEEWARLKNGK